MLSSWLQIMLLSLFVMVGNAGAVERPRLSIEKRIQDAELVIVADDIELLPRAGREFDKFYRVEARVAGVLKGHAAVADRIEVVVDNTIAEYQNDCCAEGKVYVLFLRKKGEQYHFVGSPSGAVPVELQGHQSTSP